MLLVDVTVVQVALPTIQRRLDANFSDLQWVIDAYAVTLATLIMTWGSMSDRFGRKRVFLIGLAVFTAASILCGVATTAVVLIWARALQGVGGAAMFATGLALIGQEFRGVERGKAIAAWSATVGAAVAVGPLFGGAITSGLGWRWIFFINVPIGIVTGWLGFTRMMNVSDTSTTRLDIPGVASFSAAMFLLVFGIIRTNTEGWVSAATISCLIAAALLIALFVWIEHRVAHPMFDLGLFRRPSFTGVSLGTVAIGGGMFAVYPFLTLYLQNNLGFSPLRGGLCLLPSTVLCFAVPVLFRSVMDRMSPQIALGGGLAVVAAGLAAMLPISRSSSWELLIPGLLLTGFGIGFANPAIARVGLGVVPPQRSGMASGISNTCRIGGLATGVAALGAIFQSQVSRSLSDHLGHPAPALAKVVTSSGVRAAVAAANGQAGFAPAAHSAFVSGMRLILSIGAILLAAGALASFTLVRAKDFYAQRAAD